MLVKLLNYVEIISGGTPKTNVSAYWNGNIPWIAIDDFKETNKYIYETKKCITYDGLKNSNTNILRNKDIIISARGTVGKLALIHHDMAFNQSCFGIHIKDKLKLDPEYLFYYLKSNLIFILKKSQGAIFDSINLDSFKYIEIDLPPIIEQIKCTEILSSIDFQIERNNAMVKRLQVLALRTFDYYSTVSLESNSVILKDIIVERDKSKIQVNDVQEGSGNYPFFTSGESILYTDKQLTKGFNIYLSTGGNAKVQSYYGEAAYSTDTWCITAKDNLQFYLYGYLKHIEAQMDKLYFHGTGLKHLQKPIFLKSKIYIPKGTSLEKYNKIVTPFYRQISEIQKVNFRLQAFKSKLLPLLINEQIA